MEYDVIKAAEIFDELIDRAIASEEIVITVAGVPVARLVPHKVDFKEFLKQGVSLEELDSTRDQSLGRDADIES